MMMNLAASSTNLSATFFASSGKMWGGFGDNPHLDVREVLPTEVPQPIGAHPQLGRREDQVLLQVSLARRAVGDEALNPTKKYLGFRTKS